MKKFIFAVLLMFSITIFAEVQTDAKQSPDVETIIHFENLVAPMPVVNSLSVPLPVPILRTPNTLKPITVANTNFITEEPVVNSLSVPLPVPNTRTPNNITARHKNKILPPAKVKIRLLFC